MAGSLDRTSNNVEQHWFEVSQPVFCDGNAVGYFRQSPKERGQVDSNFEIVSGRNVWRADGVGREKSSQLGDSNPADRFTLDTAKKTGVSEQTVQRDAERGKKISEQALSLVKGTKLDNGSYLDKLKKLSPSEQVYAARSLALVSG